MRGECRLHYNVIEGPKRARRATKEPVGNDEPPRLKLNLCNKKSMGSDIRYVIAPFKGHKGPRRTQRGLQDLFGTSVLLSGLLQRAPKGSDVEGA